MKTLIYKQSEGGWALVTVLWALVMLSMLAGSLQTLTATSLRGEAQALAGARVDALFEATLARAVLGMTDHRIEERWRVDGEPENFEFEGVNFEIRIQDELGKIDINSVGGGVFRELLRSANVAPRQVDEIADAILAWRSQTGLDLLNSPKDEDYEALGYRPRRGPFQSVDELKLIIGITPEIFEHIAPALTVYTHEAMIEPSIAPPEALAAYPALLNDEFTLTSRRDTARDGVLPLSIPLAARSFSIHISAEIDGRDYAQSAVIQMTGDAERPYFLLDWD